MLKIFNSLGRELQEFKPIEKGKVRFYQCGPTVYWTQHIGNMRAATIGDLVNRSLSYLGYDVKYVRNYTDFGHLTGDNIGDADIGEDRMEKAVKRENITPQEIADKYIEEFETDTNRLNLLPPTVIARATNYLDEMITMIKELLDKGYAYETSKAVYFDTAKFPDYTKLSGRIMKKDIVGAGSGDVVDENKKNPADFVLWFFRTGPHANALQHWDSPFHSDVVESGDGFPGWHIECSAMVRANLGKTIDIHMGGVEHVSIHHTNEIAQSESANQTKYANYWMHYEHLLVDSQKMSKSLGNVYSVSDLIQKGYNPIDLRYFFLQSHYRSKQNFTWMALDASHSARQKILKYLGDWSEDNSDHVFEISKSFKEKFVEALEDDFNFPQAIAVLWDIIKSDLDAKVKLATVLDFDKVLGLKLEEELNQPRQKEEITEAAKKLVEERKLARANKDWTKADELRDRLKEEFGIDVKDTKGRTGNKLGIKN